MNNNGQLLDDFQELNYYNKTYNDAIVDKGSQYLQKLHSAVICPVFYKDKWHYNSEFGISGLDLNTISNEVNWGDQTDLIKQEGFYLFGGCGENNNALGDLIIFKVKENFIQKKAEFTVLKPITFGKSPPARYMHSMDHC